VGPQDRGNHAARLLRGRGQPLECLERRTIGVSALRAINIEITGQPFDEYDIRQREVGKAEDCA